MDHRTRYPHKPLRRPCPNCHTNIETGYIYWRNGLDQPGAVVDNGAWGCHYMECVDSRHTPPTIA